MTHLRNSWTEGHTRCALLMIAALAILLSLTTLVDLIKQNTARGQALRASLSGPHRMVVAEPPPNTAVEQVATALP